MLKKPLEAMEERFSKVSDPRIDTITLAICAVICGPEGRTDKEDGLLKVLAASNQMQLPYADKNFPNKYRVHGNNRNAPKYSAILCKSDHQCHLRLAVIMAYPRN